MSITKDQPSFAQATDPPHVPVSALKRPTAELKERHQSDTSDKVYQDNAQGIFLPTRLNTTPYGGLYVAQ